MLSAFGQILFLHKLKEYSFAAGEPYPGRAGDADGHTDRRDRSVSGKCYGAGIIADSSSCHTDGHRLESGDSDHIDRRNCNGSFYRILSGLL